MNFMSAHTGHHHHGGRTTESEDGAGEDTEDLMTMPLFQRSEPDNINTTSTTTDTSSIIPVHLIEKEHMFDKVVTPSDVGKLNRLVIPKQHAERYFPLDSSTNEKGLLLNFEDRNGKPWRFRYSYWNSSQSYVMTKGWSRFVKEKKLDAGDTVSFQRGLGEFSKDRLFIDWSRRPDAPELIGPPSHVIPLHHHQFSYHHRSLNPWTNGNSNNPLFLQPFPHPHHHNHGYNNSTIVNGNPCPTGSLLYLRPGVGARNEPGFVDGPQQDLGMLQLQRIGGVRGMVNTCNEQQAMVFDSVPVVQGKAAAKRLRLFGVNMDCPVSEIDESDKLLSSTAHQAIMPIFGNFGGFDSSSSLPTASSVPSRVNDYRSYDDREENGDDDKGKGNSMSLDLDI